MGGFRQILQKYRPVHQLTGRRVQKNVNKPHFDRRSEEIINDAGKGTRKVLSFHHQRRCGITFLLPTKRRKNCKNTKLQGNLRQILRFGVLKLKFFGNF
jgi:hypothetical protein